ncbi:hypothetical protein HDU67_008609 [Dinochytrium kinnereticum]|nr:hypothetical protein HDU67_008609 [Dinochytrium kinnereticum]
MDYYDEEDDIYGEQQSDDDHDSDLENEILAQLHYNSHALNGVTVQRLVEDEDGEAQEEEGEEGEVGEVEEKHVKVKGGEEGDDEGLDFSDGLRAGGGKD